MSIDRKLAIHIFIKGRVQGVSFRYFTLKQAQNLNTEGWVRNNPKGNVEVFAQEDKTNLELFIEILQQGQSFSRVDDMKLIWEHTERDYSDFPLSNKCN
ncbi:uncharacterized protein METZ01_LOCUS340652 [marine metagenome]|uniref:Acylphosphatase-like domain-containing protein n=1 Tax=marine metagenome TaxID=408172 RepID=A0A382QSB8_9ZZZZ